MIWGLPFWAEEMLDCPLSSPGRITNDLHPKVMGLVHQQWQKAAAMTVRHERSPINHSQQELNGPWADFMPCSHKMGQEVKHEKAFN